MPGWRVKYPEKFVKDLLQGLYDAGDETFKRSQQYVPVDRGKLKSSGVPIKLPNGFRIVYRTTYAACQEFGVEPGTTEQVQQHTVKKHQVATHQRTMKKTGKTVTVPTHWRGPFERGPFTRVYRDGIPGKFYLSKAWDEVRPKITEFVTRLARRS